MTNLTIRRIDPEVKERLRVRAAEHGRSMEEEVRQILKEVCAPRARPHSLMEIAEELFGEANGVELELPPRTYGRPPPDLAKQFD